MADTPKPDVGQRFIKIKSADALIVPAKNWIVAGLRDLAQPANQPC